jgi:signal transduction histidine kinase
MDNSEHPAVALHTPPPFQAEAALRELARPYPDAAAFLLASALPPHGESGFAVPVWSVAAHSHAVGAEAAWAAWFSAWVEGLAPAVPAPMRAVLVVPLDGSPPTGLSGGEHAVVLVSPHAGAFGSALEPAAYPAWAALQGMVRAQAAEAAAEAHRQQASTAARDLAHLYALVRMLTAAPSAQAVMAWLGENLFGPHITTCALLHYGPQHSDRPVPEPVAFIEIRGRWSRRNSAGAGVGTRLYLKGYRSMIAEVEKARVLLFDDVQHAPGGLFSDPLTQGYLRLDDVRSLALVALGTGERRTGLLLVGSDRVGAFSPREVHVYSALGDILYMNATARMMRQQQANAGQARTDLLDAMTDGVVIVNEHGSVVTVNDVFRTWFAIDEDVPGETLFALLRRMALPEAVRDDLEARWRAITSEDSESHRGTCAIADAHGRTIDLEWRSVPMYAPGTQPRHDAHRSDHYRIPQVVGRLYTFYDVSAEQAAQRLRAAFLSRVSHELRTPLMSISGFAEFILDMDGDRLPDRARGYIEIIIDSAKQLATIFTDMIEMTRADAGEMKLDRGLRHLPDAIIDAAAALEMRYLARRQRLRLDLDDEMPRVEMDGNRMIQVFTNLIGNAIKYSPEAGTITVRARVATTAAALGSDAPPDVRLPAAWITVEDEGGGLSEEEAEKVFMPFFRTERAHQQKIDGVGLGLAVTRSIVEAHGGRIWVVPVPRAPGGCFSLTLPISPALLDGDAGDDA